jgi:hypothetical protein
MAHGKRLLKAVFFAITARFPFVVGTNLLLSSAAVKI